MCIRDRSSTDAREESVKVDVFLVDRGAGGLLTSSPWGRSVPFWFSIGSDILSKEGAP